MKAWWAGLAARERLILMVGGAVLALIVFWIASWEPLVQGRSALRAEVARLSAEAVWMDQVADDVRRRARLAPASTSVPAQGSVLTLIEVSANAAGLRQALSRVQPEGAGARLSFDQVGFDPLMSWLADLESRQGLQVTQLSIDVGEAPGQVAARILLERSQ